jgi:2-hydroxy-3-oxopropionate reductase
MERQTIGFVGLGYMGAPMASNLLRAGFEVKVHNRSDQAARRLESEGATRVAAVADLAADETLIFMLPDLPYIEEAAAALLERWRERPPAAGTAVVVMSSVSPAAVMEFGAVVEAASGGNAVVVDAPVSGGTVGAAAGTLAIMVGAEAEQFERLAPVFNALGSTVRRLGPLGAGSLAKACNQLMVGTTAAALAEAVVLAERSGLDLAVLLEVLGGGLANSNVLQAMAPRFLARDYTPTGPAKFMHKDLGFVLDAAQLAGTATPLARTGVDLYATLKEQGLGDLDLSVVRQLIENLSDVPAAARS